MQLKSVAVRSRDRVIHCLFSRLVSLLLLVFFCLVLLCQSVLAGPVSLSYTIDSSSFSNFRILIQQAENTAASAIEQAFQQDPSATEVAVTVLAERNGQEVPLLSTTVSRSQWQQEPSIRAWTTYFERPAIALLGFSQTQVAQQPTLPPPAFISRPARSRLEDVPGYRDD